MSLTQAIKYDKLVEQSGLVKLACLKPLHCLDSSLAGHLDEWLATNAGALHYVDDRHDILVKPFATRPWAQSLFIASFVPETVPSPLQNLPSAQAGRPSAEIAPYALKVNYHISGQEKLRKLSDLLQTEYGPAQMEMDIDSGPVMEKPLAQLAGIGSYAVNSLIYDSNHGCGIHLGLLFTSLDLPARIYDTPPTCPQCGRCLHACPNAAFSTTGPFQVRRCRAWLSAEHRGPLSWEEQILLGNTLYGCGRCTSACPTSDFAPPLNIDLEQFLSMPSATITRLIQGTALEHSGTTMLKRNAVSALGQQLSPHERRQWRPRLLALCQSPAVIQTIGNWPSE